MFNPISRSFFNYPPRGMVIEDNRLLMSACVFCYGDPVDTRTSPWIFAQTGLYISKGSQK